MPTEFIPSYEPTENYVPTCTVYIKNSYNYYNCNFLYLFVQHVKGVHIIFQIQEKLVIRYVCEML